LVHALGVLELHDLRRAGLAADVEPRDLRAPAGAAALDHHAAQRLADDLEIGRVDRQRAGILDGLRRGDTGRRHALAREARPDDLPRAERAVGDGELERRQDDVALSDRDRDGLAGEPGLAEPLLLPGAARIDAAALVLEPDAGGPAEAERAHVL